LEATRNTWEQPGTRPAVRKNFTAVLDCGTPALGWEVYASDTEEKYCYHTCKSRFCPSCGYRATLLWLEEQEASLPDVPYSGGAKALIIAVPHTFGGDLKFNCHIHLLVSAGLQESDERWIPYLPLNKESLMRMWRYAVISHLRLAFKAHVLRSDLTVQAFGELLSEAYESERHRRWIIFVDRIVSKAHFLRYAARYVRRPPIATWRLLKITDTEVEFVAKDTQAGRLVPKRVTIPQFVRLLAAHVPDKYRHGIRYFGLLAPRAKRLSRAALFTILGQISRPRPQRLSWRNSLIKYFGIDPLIDGRGQEMHWVRQERATAA